MPLFELNQVHIAQSKTIYNISLSDNKQKKRIEKNKIPIRLLYYYI